MSREFNRRIVLKGLAFAAPAVIAACESPTPTPTEVDTTQWPVANIAADNEAHMIPSPGQYLSTDIGLTELYVVNSSSVPYVFTLLLFDRAKVKGGNEPNLSPFLRSRLKGVMGLQAVEDKFIPAKPELVPDDPKSVLDPQNFRSRAYQIGGALLESRGWPPNFTGFIRKASSPDKPSTIVLGEGLVAYKDNPSPQSYLKVRFQFGQAGGQLTK